MAFCPLASKSGDRNSAALVPEKQGCQRAKGRISGSGKRMAGELCERPAKKTAFRLFHFRPSPPAPGHSPQRSKPLYNLGDWLHYNSYAVFDGESLKLKYFDHS